MWLSVLPWGFVVLGLSPLWLFPRQDNLYPGVVFLLAALLFAATASLFARVSRNHKTNFFWVLGLSLISMVMAVEAARDMAVVPNEIATAAALAGMFASGVFLIGLYFLNNQSDEPAKPKVERRNQQREILGQEALQSLSPSLEALSAVRPITLLLLHTRTDLKDEDLLQHIRQPDMIFHLRTGQYLIALQGSSIDGAQIVFRRIRQNLLIQAYAVLPLQGHSIEKAIVQLEGELDHFYLTQH